MGYALRVAVDPDVLAHDVLNGFDDCADGHGLCGFLIEGGLQFVDGLLKTFPAAKCA